LPPVNPLIQSYPSGGRLILVSGLLEYILPVVILQQIRTNLPIWKGSSYSVSLYESTLKSIAYSEKWMPFPHKHF